MAAAKIVISDTLLSAIHNTWGQIASDAYALGERITNSGAVELCVDADRLGTFAGGAAEKELNDLIEAHGWTPVFKKLCRSVKLV